MYNRWGGVEHQFLNDTLLPPAAYTVVFSKPSLKIGTYTLLLSTREQNYKLGKVIYYMGGSEKNIDLLFIEAIRVFPNPCHHEIFVQNCVQCRSEIYDLSGANKQQ